MKKMETDLFTPLQQAKAFVDNGKIKGCICPCCDQFVKVYKRKLNSNMSWLLLRLYKLSMQNKDQTYFHYSKFTIDIGVADFGKLRHWELIQLQDNEETDKKTSGYWMITQKGLDFIHNKIRVPKHAYIFNGKLLQFSEETTNIIESAKNKFSYEELMNETIDL